VKIVLMLFISLTTACSHLQKNACVESKEHSWSKLDINLESLILGTWIQMSKDSRGEYSFKPQGVYEYYEFQFGIHPEELQFHGRWELRDGKLWMSAHGTYPVVSVAVRPEGKTPDKQQAVLTLCNAGKESLLVRDL
jgi:hypothetical protein